MRNLTVGQAIVFAIVTLLCGMIYHFANDEGFLAHANATALIQQVHAGNFIPKVSEKKVHKLLGTDTVFIDPRFARDFEAGHLEGVNNVPVDANDTEYQAATADIAKDARIVVYCQSAGLLLPDVARVGRAVDQLITVFVCSFGYAPFCRFDDRVGIEFLPIVVM